MDPVIGQLPSNSIFMDKTTVQDRIFSDNLSIFLFSLYISIFVTFPSFAPFPRLYLFLYPPMLSRGWLICCRRYRTDGSTARFSTFLESPPLSPFLPTVVKSRYLLSGIEWILVARSKNKCLARARGHRRVKPGCAESADTYFPCIGRLLLFHCGKRQQSEHFQW